MSWSSVKDSPTFCGANTIIQISFPLTMPWVRYGWDRLGSTGLVPIVYESMGVLR